MITPKELENALRKVKPYLQQKYGVDKIGYFGSYAEGSFSPSSDIDILVSFDKSLGWEFFDIKEYLEEVFNKKVDLVTENALRKKWKNAILRQVKYV